MAQISVVIPVYNMQKFLNRCVESVLSQTFSDIDVILINDGSTDNSGEICDSFAKTDNRVRVIHKENGGLSSARNAGIHAAVSDYICFVDSDDYLEPDALETLINEATIGADVVVCGYLLDYQTHSIQNCVPSARLTLKNIGDSFPEIKAKHIIDPAWNKLYNLSFLKQNGLFFAEGEIYEDTDFNLKLLRSNPQIIIVDKCLYHYMQRKGSITKRYNPEKLETLKKRACSLIDTAALFENKTAQDYCYFWYIKYLFSSFIDLFYAGSGLSKSAIRQIIKREINDPLYRIATKKANGLSLKNSIIILIAKSRSVTLISAFCCILFKVR